MYDRSLGRFCVQGLISLSGLPPSKPPKTLVQNWNQHGLGAGSEGVPIHHEVGFTIGNNLRANDLRWANSVRGGTRTV